MAASEMELIVARPPSLKRLAYGFIQEHSLGCSLRRLLGLSLVRIHSTVCLASIHGLYLGATKPHEEEDPMTLVS